MKCRRIETLTFQINNKGRLSGITAKTALTRLYFIYCVSHRFIMEAIQVFEKHFDTLENKVSNAIEDNLLGTFIAKGTMSAHGHANEFISNLEPKKHYLAWDGEVYPKIYIKRISINGG